MKWILATIVVVALATKMAESCCLPDKVKADVFFMMNISSVIPQAGPNPIQQEVSGMGNFAFDFVEEKIALEIGPVMMKVMGQQMPLVMKLQVLMDVGKGLLTGLLVGPAGNKVCFSKVVTGKLTDKHQCMPDNADLTEVMSTPEMTMYMKADEEGQMTLALDGNCVPKLVQQNGLLPNNTGSFDVQMATDNVRTTVSANDFKVPCKNPIRIPEPYHIPSPKESLKMMPASMVANEMRRRRR